MLSLKCRLIVFTLLFYPFLSAFAEDDWIFDHYDDYPVPNDSRHYPSTGFRDPTTDLVVYPQKIVKKQSKSTVKPGSGKVFIFSPSTLSWHAYQNGKLINSGRASGGRSYCPDIGRSCRTPSGTYYIHSKGSPSCRSTRFPVGRGGAPMPYCMFYSKYYAVHGSPDVPNYNASHGCIRVPTSDAAWLNRHFMTTGTKVVVKPYR